ncbi:disintegrin and metalloproteinase domain-containing protein 28-like isoform X3 [Varroa jacobsoni]|uniref:disintegrin and metalloproteinase domain-containing protein 28-like isoform X3 n=1 Tax=Varroa jacobsoni TaxID=62625 RepID=UPI000BF9E029|nr:disintegrin and metalloproteinase domain-containing protein 28-like isoform X3 [Varroa jacobsoni]
MVRVRLKYGGQLRVWKPPIIVFLLIHLLFLFNSVLSASSWTAINPVWEVKKLSHDTPLNYPYSLLFPFIDFSLSASPPNPTGEMFSKGILVFNAFGQTFRLLLHETEHLIHDDFTTHHHEPHKNDTIPNSSHLQEILPPETRHQIIEHKIGKQGSEGCHWQGHLIDSKDSRTALSTCPQLGGIIWDNDEVYHLHSNGTHSLILKGGSLEIPTHFKCGFSGTIKSVRFPLGGKTSDKKNRRKRGIAALTTLKKGPSGANGRSRFVEMVMVHDYKQFVKFERDEKKLFERSKQVANIVNALYAPLNIFVILVGVKVWSQRDEIEVDLNAEKTLDNFLRYRMEVLARSMPNDNAQLITDVTFDQDVVGKALKGPICTFRYSGGVNKDHHESVAVVATTIAHELGHNFGMEHDDLGQCQCPQSRCLMYPASNINIPPTAWSSCSIEAINVTFSQHMDHCLHNLPKRIVGPSCGNGIVEEGEDCDCGPENLCMTRCCDARTCKLTQGSVCGHGACCDLETCRPKPPGLKCRVENGECDLSEHCDGKRPDCPADVFKANGVKCGDGNAYCFMGSCSSHEMQCKKLWGPTGRVGHRSCFDANMNGTQFGSCGYDKIRNIYAKCKSKDALCGTLHCTHLNERLEYGMLSAAKVSRFFLRIGKDTHTCRSAVVDLGATDPDPGQAANGAACGFNQACLNARCVELAQLESPPCEYGCFGHGTCNHLGHCHCDNGFAPPYCNFPGNGGSIDSGPLSNPNDVSYTTTIILSVIFLFLAPLVLFFVSWTIFSKKDLLAKWRLRRRKLAVKHAARQGPLLNLYDKTQIPKTVTAVGPRIMAKGRSHQTTAINDEQNGGPYANIQMLANGKLSIESNVDCRAVIRPARPAPPPPPGKVRPQVTDTPTSNLPTEIGVQITPLQHQPPQLPQMYSQQLKQATPQLKRTKSSGGSIRRPNAPPPPLPSAAVQGLAGTPDIPLCEHVDTIRAHLVAEQRSNLKDNRGNESSLLV